MSDEQARQDAVDPRHSVIVQAPAGSGKTTLLVARYIALLATVEAPEQILAITFTRKAASEMRERVLDNLRALLDGTLTQSSLPQTVRDSLREKARAWHVLDSPQRLLIRTIDSFNVALARAMPVATALGPAPAPADDTRPLYREATRRVLALLDSSDPIATDVERLLDWRDHRVRDVEDLLSALLGSREQWLRVLADESSGDRHVLEANIETVVVGHLEHAQQCLEDGLRSANCNAETLLELLQTAAANLERADKPSPTRVFADADALPQSSADDLHLWKGLRSAFLTKAGGLRKTVTVGDGFPPKSPEKVSFETLLKNLAPAHPMVDALATADTLPQPRYADDEWAVLASLIRVLKRAARELTLLFAERGESDHTGIGAAALYALGDDERGYTDLGLTLDARIQHLLVDEFQDTNHAQLRLLEKLTAGWTTTDGRTLFLVGDPMQSIYRFREADVGLFVSAREYGVNRIALTPLRLERNFRSRAEIVDWVNHHVGATFPKLENIAAGAVRYARSVATRGPGGNVTLLPRGTPEQAAEAIALHVATALAEHRDEPTFRAAIIVRRRGDLRAILPALLRHGVAYRALKLDPLLTRPVVQDLLAITRAVRQPADITAQLALLRAPLCGLTLAELHALQGDGASLGDADALDRLPADARSRAERLYAALDAAQRGWHRRPMRDLVEGLWHALGGSACRATTQIETALRDASTYLRLLDDADAQGLLDDWTAFIDRLDGEFTTGDPPRDDVRVEILTMHGAKGLEWDLVVLPELQRTPPRGNRRILHWLPITDDEGDEQLLLAPLRSAAEAVETDLVRLIAREQSTRNDFESQRLLYVACTRAREQLVLSATLAPKNKEEFVPGKGSLLAAMWPTIGGEFMSALPADTDDASPNTDIPNPLPGSASVFRHVDAAWQPSIGPALHWRPSLPPRQHPSDQVEYNWAGAPARRIGTVLHRLLEHAGRLGIERIDERERQRLLGRIPVLLASLGARPEERIDAGELVRSAFERTLDSDVGRWILSGDHTEAACELPVSGLRNGELDNAVIDRTFVADGVRWIIDYKSGHHVGSDLEVFLTQERERYAGQLGRYRALFAQLDSRPIRTALFLPRHQRLEVVEG